MKKILIISNSGKGLISFRKELIEVLCKSYQVIISIPDDKSKGRLEELGVSVVISKMERRSTNPFKDLALLRQYEKTIKEQMPDLVLTYTIKPNVYGGWACQKYKIPYIANITGLGTTIENGGFLSRVSLTLYKKGLRKASCVFFQNEANYKTFVGKVAFTGKSRIIPGSGVNLDEHPLEKYPKNEIPDRLLYMGRIMKDKGIEELLYAMKTVKNKGYNVVLDIIGNYDEDYKSRIEEAEKDGFVKYYGFQYNVNTFIKRSHCVVLPSYHEGMSNVMLEAASTGRPVITTTVPGCRETFEEGITGFGCDARDGDSLVDAIIKLISLPMDKREEMGLRGREKMEKEFSRKIIVQAYLEEIESILA